MADFRSYLSTVDPYALAYTGNDGIIDPTKGAYDTKSNVVGSTTNKTAVQNYISGLYGQYQTQQQTQSNSSLDALRQQIASLQQQQAYQPKLPTYDVVGNYQRAQSQAEASVNPLYDKYLNDYLAQEAVKKQNKQQETDLTLKSNATDLASSLEGNSVDRARTFEDTRQGIGDINTQEGQFQQDSGLQADTDRRALAETTAASGLSSTGVGAGRMFDQTTARNLTEGRQVQEFNNQKAAKTLLQNRTVEDLAKGDNDAKSIAGNKDASANFDLESYLEGLAGDETNFRNSNESDRLGAVADQTGTYAQQGTQSFLQSLAGAGWKPRDIALAYQVYG